MLKTWSYIVNNDSRLDEMMRSSLSIYDKTLYIQRQRYFETKEQGKIKTCSYNELWNIVKEDEIVKNSCLDYNVKQYVVRQVSEVWNSFVKSLISYKNDKKKFNSAPKIPNYLYKTKQFNIVQIDKTRFRKIDYKVNSITLPKSNFTIKLTDKIKIKDIRQITIQKFYGKTKINIIYEDREVIKNNYDPNSCVGIDLGVNNLCAITSNDKSFSYVINGRPLKSMNQYYNKKVAKAKQELEKCNKKKTSKKLYKLSYKRNNKIKHYLHCTSKQIIDFCVKNKVEKIVVGHNNNWKQNVNIGKKNNQTFINIPFNQLINQLQYKSKKYTDLEVVVVEES